MRNVHFIMQAKGGVGKSFIAIIFAQYLLEHKSDILFADVDPSNQTFSQVEALPVQYIRLMSDNDRQVDISKLDSLYETILLAPGDVLIDSGASSYIQLFTYLGTDYGLKFFNEDNCRVIIHVPVVGGEARNVCMEKLYEMVKAFSGAEFVLWLNNYPYKVFKGSDNDMLEKDPYFIKCKDRIKAIVTMPEFPEDTFGRALKLLMDNRKTFSEVLDPSRAVYLGNNPVTSLQRMRLKIIKQKLWESLSVLDALI